MESAWSSGHFEGRVEGRAEGRAEGISQGKWESAKAMAEDGLPLEKISQYTGIPLEELKNNL